MLATMLAKLENSLKSLENYVQAIKTQFFSSEIILFVQGDSVELKWYLSFTLSIYENCLGCNCRKILKKCKCIFKNSASPYKQELFDCKNPR